MVNVIIGDKIIDGDDDSHYHNFSHFSYKVSISLFNKCVQPMFPSIIKILLNAIYLKKSFFFLSFQHDFNHFEKNMFHS